MSPSPTKVKALNICIIAGSTRISGPPRPVLSDRVVKFVASSVISRSEEHNVEIIRAKDNLPLLQKPHFSYAKSQVPENLSTMHNALINADAYIAITPEYNHAPCPGLVNLLNHFGSSTFSFKPSAIVSYSAGQWGGTRAAHSLRPTLSELGCLPVSAMMHIPQAMNILNENGGVVDDSEGFTNEERWRSYSARMLSQLEWWAQATKTHREKVDPFQKSPSFTRTPTERNAPPP